MFIASTDLTMASPPMISAPTLVTTTNLATVGTPTHAGSAAEEWRCKYLEAKDHSRKLKTQMREQAKKSRQLILAVKTKLQDEESEKVKVRKKAVFCYLISIFASTKNNAILPP